MTKTMATVWIPSNDLDYYYANGFPSKYWLSPEKNTIQLSITTDELSKWEKQVPKSNFTEKASHSKKLLND